MAAKKSSLEPVLPPKLIVPRSEAKKQIEGQLNKAYELRGTPIKSDADVEIAKSEATKWRNVTTTMLANIFSDTSKASEYAERTREVNFSLVELSSSEEADIFKLRMNARITELESILESLEFIPELPPARPQSQLVSMPAPNNTIHSNKVFIVHGHDEGKRDAVASLLHQLKLSPVILAEQANKGQTIIEKFEQSSNEVSYAVVLLTPDDIGTSKDKPNELKPRARQNVIFELGYFAAKLGRKNVCALHKGGIEIPTDYQGVAYVSMDSEDWKWRLAREIKQIIPVDLNLLD